MVRGGAFSVGLHVLIIGAIAADLAFFGPSNPLESDLPIPVELTILGTQTNQALAGEKVEDQPTPPEASAPDEPPPPTPAAAAEPEPLPDTNTLVSELPKPEPAPEPEPVEDVAAAPPLPAPRPPDPVVVERRADKSVQPRERISEQAEKLAALEPLPVPEEKPKEEPKPEPEKKPEPKPEPEVAKVTPPKPEPKPETEKKPALDLNSLSAKLDKLATEKPARPREQDKRKISDIRIGEGGVSQNRLNPQLSVREIDLVRGLLSSNWSPNHGAPGIERMQVLIRIFLNPDGTLARPPRVVDGFDAGQSAAVYNAFSESALRAVQKSQPFPLPPEKFQDWQEIEINFNLRGMYG